MSTNSSQTPQKVNANQYTTITKPPQNQDENYQSNLIIPLDKTQISSSPNRTDRNLLDLLDQSNHDSPMHKQPTKVKLKPLDIAQSPLIDCEGFSPNNNSNTKIFQRRESITSSTDKKEKDLDIFKSTKEDEEKKRQARFWYFNKILQNNLFNVFVGILTICVLFASDLNSAVFPQEADSQFDVIFIVCLILFSLEIVASIFVKQEYLFSFFFYLDLLSTFTLLFDLSIVSNSLFNSSSTLASAGRASIVGARAGRIVRIVRLVRLVRIAKLYKEVTKVNEGPKAKDNKIYPQNTQQTETVNQIDKKRFTLVNLTLESDQQKQNGILGRRSSEQWGLPQIDQSILKKQQTQYQTFDDIPKKSRVGKQLSDLTTKRVIILILCLLFMIPMFSSDYWNDSPGYINIAAGTLNAQINLLNNTETRTKVIKYVIDSCNQIYQPGSSYNDNPLLWKINSSYLQFNEGNLVIENYRTEEYDGVTIEDSNGQFTISVYIGKVAQTQLNSILSMAKTIFVCLVLTLAAIYFSKDANDLALLPIERMIQKVNQLAKNPLALKDLEIQKSGNSQDQFETVMIENAIIKIGTLLALGFGEAGSDIVAMNMAQSGDVNPMIPGTRKVAIFGFCDIRNFTDATEVLQSEVMVFVNSIAQIVHSQVDKFRGAANKNIGDAFLLVWRFPTQYIQGEGQNIELQNCIEVQNIADLSLISFLKVITKITKSRKLNQYRQNKELNKRLPNYRVKMGFGLHIGWAIEGAIGSVFKIDASYLSPNVNMASRLEAATKQYGVLLLISGLLYDYFTPQTQDKCRCIDYVTVKGSKQPIKFYTVDIDTSNLGLAKNNTTINNNIVLHQKNQIKKSKKQILIDNIDNEGYMAYQLFEDDKELKTLLECQNQLKEFKNIFNSGFSHYLNGKWSEAKSHFETCLNYVQNDGPSKTLLNVLRETDYICPSSWKGFRELTEKQMGFVKKILDFIVFL